MGHLSAMGLEPQWAWLYPRPEREGQIRGAAGQVPQPQVLGALHKPQAASSPNLDQPRQHHGFAFFEFYLFIKSKTQKPRTKTPQVWGSFLDLCTHSVWSRSHSPTHHSLRHPQSWAERQGACPCPLRSWHGRQCLMRCRLGTLDRDIGGHNILSLK